MSKLCDQFHPALTSVQVIGHYILMLLQRSANAEKGSIQKIQPISRQSSFTQITGGVVYLMSTFNE